MTDLVHRRDVDPAVWDAFVVAHPDGWFWHTSGWLDYCLAYQPGAEDHSAAAVVDGKVVALVPLVREGDAFTMGRSPGAPMLVQWQRSFDRLVLGDHADRLARRLGVRRWAVRSQPGGMRGGQFGGGDEPSMGGGCWRASRFPSYVVDLRGSEPKLWRGLRKSFRSLIHRREPDVMATACASYLPVAHALHVAAAGRETRSAATWGLMAEWMRQGHGLLALVRGQHAQAVGAFTGFAYVVRFKDWAYYASGATLEESTAHALQWHIMRCLKAGGLGYYEVGWGPRAGDSEKDRGIAHFKAGFGGQPWPVVVAEKTWGRPRFDGVSKT